MNVEKVYLALISIIAQKNNVIIKTSFEKKEWMQVIIKNKKKFIIRTIETLVIQITIILTPIAIIYANKVRGHIAYGGEWLVPIFGLILILIIETIYDESEEKKRSRKHEKTK